jgi:hypothetical protein
MSHLDNHYIPASKQREAPGQGLNWIGKSMKRVEDPRMLAGKGRYIDDIVLPNMAHAAVLRSPHAHARIKSIDTAKAEALPGVVLVMTGAQAGGHRPASAGRERDHPCRTARCGAGRGREANDELRCIAASFKGALSASGKRGLVRTEPAFHDPMDLVRVGAPVRGCPLGHRFFGVSSLLSRNERGIARQAFPARSGLFG